MSPQKSKYTDRFFPHPLKMGVIALSLTSLSVVALAQTSGSDNAVATDSTAAAAAASAARHQYSPVRASKFIGMNVRGANDQNIGEVEDLIINGNTAEVRYAVLEFDRGFLESDKLFSVPLSSLTYVSDDKPLGYKELSRAQLDKAAVSQADWQKALENSRYVLALDSNYGLEPPAGEFRSMRASDLLGKDANSRDDKNIGEIRDLVLDVHANKVDYVVFAFDPSWFSKEKMFAFPLTAFKPQNDSDDLILDVDRNTVQSMKSFNANDWGKITDLNRDEFINRPTPK